MNGQRSKLVFACMLTLLLGGVSGAVDIQADDCADAPLVGNVAGLEFDTRGTTFDGPGHYIDGPNIWYRYIASCTGDVTVSLLGSSDFDTMLAVYSGSGCYPAGDDLIASNDNFNMLLQSQVTFPAVAGDEFLIEIGGFNSAVSEGVLTIICDGEPGPVPSRDKCSEAFPIGDMENLAFDTRDATFDGQGSCLTSPNIWYCYTATCTGDVTVSLSGTVFDTMMAVYDGCGCYPTFAVNLIGCDDDSGENRASEITFAAVAGNQYLIEVGGYGTETGQGVMTVSCEPASIPSKDDCVEAKPIGDVVDLPFDTTSATFDGPGLCLTSPNIWYCYTASCTGDATISLLGSGYDTMLAVYKGCECYPAQNDLIECNDDFDSAYQSQVTIPVVAGGQYLIEIGGYGSETGQGVLNVICEGKAAGVRPDLGDAPDSTNNSGNKTMDAYPSVVAHFPTVFNDSISFAPYTHGPVHLNDRAVAYLGKSITGETEADTGTDDDGINNIRSGINSPDHDGGDDGVNIPLVLPNCGWTMFDYEVTVIDPNTNLWVNVWLDFNRDGDWDDTINCPDGSKAPEWAVQNQFLFNLPVGLSEIITPGFKSAHAGAHGQIWMRITLSEQPWIGGSNPGQQGNAGSGPLSKYEIGETEDYYFTPQISGDGDCPLCEDLNGDGVINMNDLDDLTATWLETCL